MRPLVSETSLLFTVLISTVFSAEKLEQKLMITKPASKLAILECKFSANCGNYIHWYQKKGDEIRRVQHVDVNNGNPINERGFEYLKSSRKGIQSFALNIPELKPEHSATYYCACWKLPAISSALFELDYHTVVNEKVFGSGTRLFVTGERTEPPKLSAFPVSRSGDGRSVLLCQARGMYPDLVRFIWKYQAGNEVKLSDTEELLEQRDEGQEVRVTSMLIIDQQKARSNTFTCSVQHDRSANNDLKSVVIPAGNSEDETKPEINPNPVPIPTCPPPKEEEEEEKEEEKEVENYGISK
ncbi:immunoglobulin gamma-1 heavy chain [Astyanax mexicanus]|uniref:immunoglobulin gamma-1 heavy chain n=1 Tax=Astyanax mexicanus TaxID=7994 RepID=UPI0020CACEFD|nr:immunoglobulin gamma-1 heavy chain [Astyanax mexicanus]